MRLDGMRTFTNEIINQIFQRAAENQVVSSRPEICNGMSKIRSIKIGRQFQSPYEKNTNGRQIFQKRCEIVKIKTVTNISPKQMIMFGKRNVTTMHEDHHYCLDKRERRN